MRKALFILLAAAAVAAVSCAKEIAPETNPTPETELVPMTFTATADDGGETKVMYNEKNTMTEWQLNDEIKVISSNGTVTTFTATSVSYGTAVFEGLTEPSAEKYYAVYPASAYVGDGSEVENSKLYVEIPAEQTPVEGSFDPNAFVSIAESFDGETLSFKNICSVVRFSFQNASDVKSVKFKGYTKNNDTRTAVTNLAGKGVVNTSDITTHTYDNTYEGRTAFDVITVNAPDGGFKDGTNYYFTLRPNTQMNGGIDFYYETSDGISVRKSENTFSAAKNTIRPLGTIDNGNETKATPYESYNLGFDLVVAGKPYSASSLGSATLISENTTISENGVYFIAEGVDVQISKGPYSKLFVIGNSLNSKTDIALTEQFRYSTNGVIGFKNLAFEQYTTDMFVHNNSAEATRFAFDDCYIIMPTSNGVMYNGSDRTVLEFAMHNCDIQVTGDSQVFLRTSANYSNIDLHNNIFYSAEGDKLDFYFINYSGNVVDNLKLTQNTFANVYNITSVGGQNPYINVSSVGNYTLENNLFYLERYNTYNNPTSWILSCVPAASTINNNMLFKDINNQRLQVYKGGAYTAFTDTKANVVNGDVDLTIPTIVPATTAGATR